MEQRAMVYLGTVDDHVRLGKGYTENAELAEFASLQGFEVPKDYKYMPVTLDFLVNDNVKWHVPHIFEPDKYAWHMVEDEFMLDRNIKWANCKPLSFEAAVQRAEKDSSPGYIFKKHFKCMTKKQVFTNHSQYLIDKIQEISEGKDVPMIWEHGPKCEMRPIDKFTNPDISKRKQRTFMIADTLHYIVGLILYAEQNDVDNLDWDSNQSWSAAGMSIYYGGWDTLARILLSGGSKFKCKDVSAMEASVRTPFQTLIYRARNYNYLHRHYQVGEPWQHKINYVKLATWWVKVLMYGPTIDVNGHVWMRFGMNPSGQLNTLMDNIHALRMVFTYHLAKKCDSVVQLKQLANSLIVKLMGDDSIFPDNPKWDGLDSSAAEIGFTMTDEIAGSVHLREAKFCGFGWTYNVEYGMWQYRADTKKVLSRVYGFRKKNSWRYTLANLYAAKMLLFGTKHFHEINSLISYITVHHMADMYSEKNYESEIPISALFTQDKTEDQIAQLIFNVE